jgi:uncharacterized protein (DUF58 family)
VRPYRGPKEVLDAARDPTTGPEALRRLAASVYSFVQVAVARHPAVEPTVLLALVPAQIVTVHEQELAAAIAEHPAAPAEALAQVAARLPPVLNRGRNTFWGNRAGLAVCRHPATPLAALERLLTDRRVTSQVRRRIASTTTRPDVLVLLLRDPSSVVRRRAAQRQPMLTLSDDSA